MTNYGIHFADLEICIRFLGSILFIIIYIYKNYKYFCNLYVKLGKLKYILSDKLIGCIWLHKIGMYSKTFEPFNSKQWSESYEDFYFASNEAREKI